MGMRRVCAWCGTEMDPVSAEASRAHAVTHGICEPCREKLLGTLGTPLDRFLDTLGVPVLLVSGDVESERLNDRAVAMVGRRSEEVRGQPLGTVFECENARLPGGCGRTPYCSGCAIRGSVTHTHATGAPVRRRPATLKRRSPTEQDEAELFISTEKAGERVLLKIERE